MIGLVLVSHSARLAEGAAELAAQMAGPDLRIAAAGGLDLPERPLGTDAALVARAIDAAWSDDGVLVLMDLGSAVLSAELALELLDERRRAKVLLSAAPLVEGAVAAAVAAAAGGSLVAVAAEAAAGLAGKTAQLAPVVPAGDAPTAGPTAPSGGPRGRDAGAAGAGTPAGDKEPEGEQALRIVVHSPLGLHARPVARLVRTAAGFDADVTVEDVTAGRGPVSARSLSAVATLGASRGHELVLRARGVEAAVALAALRALADDDFGDRVAGAPGGPPRGPAVGPSTGAPGPDAPASSEPGVAPASDLGTAAPLEPGAASPPERGKVLQGLPAAPGVAIGPARWLAAPTLEAPASASSVGDPRAEWDRLQAALAATRAELRGARESVAARAGAAHGAIFDAHLLLLDDEALLGPARAAVLGEGTGAAAAWAAAAAQAAAAWDALDDPYLRARGADLRQVAGQVLRHLGETPGGEPSGRGSEPAGRSRAVVVLAPDLSPAQAAALGDDVLGVACAGGGPTSHGAILARALGVPAVMGCGPALLAVANGTPVVLDGDAGTLTVDPPAAVWRAAAARRSRRAAAAAAATARAAEPAVTRDGLTVPVEANLGEPGEVAAALAAGADGVGLLRTEFLFLRADHLPTEDEQERAYRAIAAALGGRPLVLRTLDAGADKSLPYLPAAHEDNPFLGLRGVRLGLRRPELLTGQLRAALRVAADHPLRLLLPMVTGVDEVLRVRALVEEARADLAAAAVAVPLRLEVGVMIEVPAAALLAAAFAPHVDFFSIGTNDLTQYVLAAERGNAAVAGLGDALHPAVLRLIAEVTRAAAGAGRPVAVCGEIAGDPQAVPLLLGLGVDALSMAPARMALAKQAVRRAGRAGARRLAARALRVATAAEVRRLVSR